VRVVYTVLLSRIRVVELTDTPILRQVKGVPIRRSGVRLVSFGWFDRNRRAGMICAAFEPSRRSRPWRGSELQVELVVHRADAWCGQGGTSGVFTFLPCPDMPFQSDRGVVHLDFDVPGIRDSLPFERILDLLYYMVDFYGG